MSLRKRTRRIIYDFRRYIRLRFFLRLVRGWGVSSPRPSSSSHLPSLSSSLSVFSSVSVQFPSVSVSHLFCLWLVGRDARPLQRLKQHHYSAGEEDERTEFDRQTEKKMKLDGERVKGEMERVEVGGRWCGGRMLVLQKRSCAFQSSVGENITRSSCRKRFNYCRSYRSNTPTQVCTNCFKRLGDAAAGFKKISSPKSLQKIFSHVFQHYCISWDYLQQHINALNKACSCLTFKNAPVNPISSAAQFTSK